MARFNFKKTSEEPLPAAPSPEAAVDAPAQVARLNLIADEAPADTVLPPLPAPVESAPASPVRDTRTAIRHAPARVAATIRRRPGPVRGRRLLCGPPGAPAEPAPGLTWSTDGPADEAVGASADGSTDGAAGAFGMGCRESLTGLVPVRSGCMGEAP